MFKMFHNRMLDRKQRRAQNVVFCSKMEEHEREDLTVKSRWKDFFFLIVSVETLQATGSSHRLTQLRLQAGKDRGTTGLETRVLCQLCWRNHLPAESTGGNTRPKRSSGNDFLTAYMHTDTASSQRAKSAVVRPWLSLSTGEPPKTRELTSTSQALQMSTSS